VRQSIIILSLALGLGFIAMACSEPMAPEVITETVTDTFTVFDTTWVTDTVPADLNVVTLSITDTLGAPISGTYSADADFLVSVTAPGAAQVVVTAYWAGGSFASPLEGNSLDLILFAGGDLPNVRWYGIGAGDEGYVLAGPVTISFVGGGGASAAIHPR